MGRWSVRQAVLFGAPLLMAIATVLHPLPPFSEPGMLEFLRPRLSLWMGVHLVQLGLVLLLGIVLWFLTEGLPGRAATVSRVATACFLVFYAAFDSIAGIGTGLLAKLLERAPPIDPGTAADVVDRFWLARFDAPVGPLIGIADLSWLTAVVAAALALRSHHAPRAALLLLLVAGIAFAIDHPMPTGTVGMLALLAANVVLHRHRMLTSEQRSA
jgi:hypothetical protein